MRYMGLPSRRLVAHGGGGVLVQVDMDRQGRLRRALVLKSSGDPQFDGDVLLSLGARFAQGKIKWPYPQHACPQLHLLSLRELIQIKIVRNWEVW